MSYQEPDLRQRQNLANAAKKAMLEKFSAALEDPAAAQRRAERMKIHEERLARIAERDAAKKKLQAEMAEQAARKAAEAAELALKAQRDADEAEARLATEMAERQTALEAEQKAARDERYAARKAAKKKRRRGY